MTLLGDIRGGPVFPRICEPFNPARIAYGIRLIQALELMDPRELRQHIVDAFSSVPRPGHDEIAPHKCIECDELARDFSRFTATEMPDDVFRRHVFDMPLLSDQAQHYYLPAWLIRCLTSDGPHFPDEANAVVSAFDCTPPPEPCLFYTNEQLQVVLRCLDYLVKYAGKFDLEEIERARKRVSYEL